MPKYLLVMLLRSQHDIFIFISMYLKLKTISDVLVAANRGIRVDINHARSDEDLLVSTSTSTHWIVAEETDLGRSQDSILW